MASLLPLPGILGRRRAAHLLRRASYRYTAAQVDALAALTAPQAVAQLLTLQPLQLDQPVFSNTDVPGQPPVTWINPPGQTPPAEDFVLRRYVMGWWTNEALHDPGIGHKMAFFFHQYFATAINAIRHECYFDYLALLRWGALGNFRKLAYKIVTDNVMLRYLNNNENTKNNPNENFAREFLELFTIGKGPQIGPGDYTNYTEDDIVQAARVLTGFRTRPLRNVIDPETGLPQGAAQLNQHDTGAKTFSAKFQNTTIAGATSAAGMWQELQAFVDMIFVQDETARTLVRRLYRFFVSRNLSAEIEADIIEPLAATLRNGGYEIAPVLSQLLQSAHFYDADDSNNADEIVGGMIKSPLELVLQSLSFFQVPIPNPLTQTQQHYAQFYSQAVIDRLFGLSNLTLFLPPDVAGYAGYHQAPDFSHQWFSSSTIIARYKLPTVLLTGTRQLGAGPNVSIGTKLNIAPWVRDSGVVSDPADSFVLVQDLIDFLLPEPPSSERFDYYLQTVFLDNLPPADWTYEWQNYLTTGNDGEVRLALERLVKALLYSPEFQTF
jgi:uncharacterized protein (DUF1800 family)